MSLKGFPFPSQEPARSQLSSVWNCSCDDAPIRDISVSPRGVVGVATDANVYLYAGAPSFGASHTLPLSPARLTAHTFSTDGTHFLTGDSKGFVKWWDVHNGETSIVTVFPYEKYMQDSAEELPPVSSVVSSARNNLIAVAAGHTLCIYGEDGTRLHSIGPLDHTIQSIQWKNADELAVNIGSAVCMIHVTPQKYTPCQKYPNELKEGCLNILACSPKGNMFSAGCTTGLVQIWDLASESNDQISIHIKGLPNAAAEDASVQCLEWDASARFVAAAGGSDVIVWDMQDTSEKEEGKDNSIVCCGHGQETKITALSFQPKGHLLATGGNDSQVFIFDSGTFTTNGVVGGLVESIASGKLSQNQSGTAITALAWHPSGLILAGTMTGQVDAFEVSGAIYETPRATNGGAVEMPFLITRVNTGRSAPSQKPNGWGGEPLIPTRNEDGAAEKGFIRRRPTGAGNTSGAPRASSGGKPKIYMGMHKQPYPRPPYNTDTMGNGAAGHWPPAMHPTTMMRWPGPPSQPMPPPFPPQQPATTTPPSHYAADTPGNPPHAPENNAGEGVVRGVPPPNIPNQHRNDRPQNRNGQLDQGQLIMPGAPPHPYPSGFMPCPSPYPMGYPMPPYCYPYQMHPQMAAEAIPGVSGYGAPPYVRPPINPPPKTQPSRDVTGKTEMSQKEGSAELEEELGSKSSEATNNGVNNNVTPSQHSEASGYYPDGRQNQGQTLYVGNLAPAVEDGLLMHLFAHYGPVVSVQVIRERETRISRGFGFVTFAHPYYAQIAMDQLDSVQIAGPFEGRKLKVSFSNRR